MSFRKNNFLVLTFSVILLTKLIAQPTNIKFDQIGLEQGISQSTVNAIVQDAQGFMWFGTQDGLNRYDGYSITVFRHDPYDTTSISDNTITSLLNDKNGNLWIGTMHGGLECYKISDEKFYHHNHKKNDSTSISGNYITSLFEDSKGNFWVGTDKGLNLFNTTKEKFIRLELNGQNKTKLSTHTIWAIAEDKTGNLWIVSSYGLFKLKLDDDINFNEIKFIRYFNGPVNPFNLSSNNIIPIFIDHEGILWIGTWGAGLYSLRDDNNSLKCYRYNSKNINSISSDYIASIYEDSRGNLWIASSDAGLMMYNYQTDSFLRYTNEALRTLYEDKSGLLWIGTSTAGVKIYEQNKNRFVHYYDDRNDKSDMNGNDIFAILEDKDNELWVGTFGDGLNHFDKNRKKIITYKSEPNNPASISDNNIFALCESKDGSIWVGTKGGLNRFDKSTGRFIRLKHNSKNINSLSFNEIMSLYEDKNGNIWIGTNKGGIDIYNPKSKKFTHYYQEKRDNAFKGTSILDIYEDDKSNMWIGTAQGGLQKYVPDSSSFVVTHTLRKSYLEGYTVFSIYEDYEGIIWIGTFNNGLYRLDTKTDSLINFTKINGLSNELIYGILSDKQGNLWLSTNKGVAKFDSKNIIFKNYDETDGLQSNEFNQGAYFKSKSGELFFGGVNGFNSFFPEEIEDNKYIPPVCLTSFKVFDKHLQLASSLSTIRQIELSYFQNFFSFEYVALNYSSPEKNQYAYKLEGFDKDWHIVPASNRYASYTNLDPGEYVLKVIGSNNDGVWNEKGTSVSIIITPPFWMTWWFRTLMIAITIVLIVGAINYFVKKKIRERTRKIEQETAIERERLRIARDMHDDLGAKVTQISILSELAKRDIEKKEPVQSYIDDISIIGKRVVHALDEIVWSVNPNNDTLESLIDYIIQHLEQFLTQAGIRYRLDIPSDIPTIPVLFDIRHNLFMMIQEALNNIVKHSAATEVQFCLNIQESTLVVSLKDNGQGFIISTNDTFDYHFAKEYNTNKFSYGLENMEKRIEEIGGTLKVNSEPGKGTEVVAIILLNDKIKTFGNW